MNPHAPQPTSPAALGKSLWRNRQLILQMTRREVLGRYKGSFMGLAWSYFTPLLMWRSTSGYSPPWHAACGAITPAAMSPFRS
jgi:hypothetical protein